MTKTNEAPDLWDGLIRESMKPGPTMTITKAQYAALREALAAERQAGRQEAVQEIRAAIGEGDEFADALNTAGGLRHRILAILAETEGPHTITLPCGCVTDKYQLLISCSEEHQP